MKRLIILLAVSTKLIAGDIEVLVNCSSPGTLVLFLVDRDNYDKPLVGLVKREVLIVKEGEYSCFFDDISPGNYGVKAFLDLNNDRKLNIGLMGPKEPWGFSWREKGKKGRPKFEDILFEHRELDSYVKVRLKND